MANYCEVVGCLSQKTNKNLSFFSLPKDEERRMKWLDVIGRPDLITKKYKSHIVCSLHFDKSKINCKPQLTTDAIPTKLLPNQPSTSNANTKEDCSDVSTQTKESYINILSAVTIKGPVKKSFCVQSTPENTKNYSTQTTLALSADTPRKRKLRGELKILNQKRRKLQLELNKIRKEVQSKDSECYQNFSLKNENEVDQRFAKLLEWQSNWKNKPKGNRYDPEFKLFALNLHFSSPQTYRCLQRFLHLPSESTLQRFNMGIPPKFEDRILNFLSAKLKSLPEKAKYCTLCIDEMVLKRHLHYDTKRDEIIGLHNINGEVTKEIASHACVIMLRGIVENWKQPIAYSFLASPKHYKELETWLDEILVKLHANGIEIQAIVSDQGSNFDKYAKEVKKITPEKPYFILNDRKIYYIFDVPYLIKCIRNNLLTNDFIYNGKQISWKYIEDLFYRQKDENLKIIPKVTEKHIRPNNFQKMRVKYAAQIFSRSVFAAINVFVRFKSLPEEAKYTADFVEKINNIFDVLNSSKVSSPNKYQEVFSLKPYQMETLEEAATMFENIRAVDKTKGVNHTKRIKTFRNMFITIKSILMLSQDLKEQGIKFLFTRRLNQDSLEKIFGAIRQQGGNCTNPTAIQFMRAFSKLFLSNMMQTSRYSNCQEDICELLQKWTFFENPKPLECHSRTPSAVALNGEVDYRFHLPARNALTYVAGYLLYKCSKKHNCDDFSAQLNDKPNMDDTKLYIHFKSYNKNTSFYGGLKVPPESFSDYVEELEKTFLNNFDKVLMNRPGSTLMNILQEIYYIPPCPCFPKDYLIKLFIRFRIYSTLKFNNREFRCKKKLDHFIKLKHI